MSQSPHPYKRPPRWLDRILIVGLGRDVAEDVLGDLHELYQERAAQSGEWKARLMYLGSLFSLLRLFQLPYSFPYSAQIPTAMLRHYFTIAFRNLLKHKSVSLINLMGLAIGLASCLLILSYVRHEQAYDAFHKNADEIFRVTYNIHMEDFNEHLIVTPSILAPMARREFPEVKNAVRLFASTAVMRQGEQVFQEDDLLYADSTFFDVFSFDVTRGNLSEALRRPKTMVLTESTARKYFESENPVGKTLLLGSNETPYEVTAVIKDIPKTSHLKFEIVVSYTSLGEWAQREQFGSANYYTYLQLTPGASAAAVEQKIAEVVQRDAPDFAAGISFKLQALKDIHLRSTHLTGGLAGSGDITYIYLFSAIGLLILLIACINYMNLSTARSVDRAKEVGLRKVVGAGYLQLFWQFMGEAFLICMTALGLALVMVQLALPWFRSLTHRAIEVSYVNDLGWTGILLGTGLLVALLAGSYPALVLARLKPIQVLRGKYKNTVGGAWLRKGLVVFQFSISIILIIATLVIKQQLDFISDKKLGYDKEHLVVLPVDGKMVSKLSSIKGALKSHPKVFSASACTEVPHQIEGGYNLMVGWGEDAEDKLVTAMAIDPDFVKTMRIQLQEGDDFTNREGEIPDEGYEFLLNEQAVALMGWAPQEAIGKRVNLNGRKGFIKGVVKNFHTASLHHEIGPVVLFSELTYRHLLVRVAPDDLNGSLAHIESVWGEWMAHRPYEYSFLDEQFAQLYREEQQIGKVFAIFAGLAILIACLGLFGLASFTTVQRAKEIGIRKVLGATVPGLIRLLSIDFLRLVGISFVLAGPIAWLLMNRWLETFIYKVNVGVGTLLLAGGTALLIAWLTLSYQAIRAAMTDPVNVLKDE